MAKINNTFNLYSSVFIPPVGYETTFAEFATYSLSKSFLSAIPAMIYCGNKGKEPENLTRIIKSKDFEEEKYYKKLHVFYHGENVSEDEKYAVYNAVACADGKGSFFRKAQARVAMWLFNNRCTPVVSKKGGLFHPKIILLQFRNINNADDIRFRLVISSRNLTWADYFETGIVLEGMVQKEAEECDSQIGSQLYKFFEKYYGGEDKLPQNQISWASLKKACFKMEEVIGSTVAHKNVSGLKLWFASDDKLIDKMLADAKKNNYDKCHIISMKPSFDIITGVKCTYICNFGDIYTDNQVAKKWVKSAANETFFAACEDNKGVWSALNIHSKMYIFFNEESKNEGGTYSVWMGSANCSANALKGDNEEVMLQYTVTEYNSESPLNLGHFYSAADPEDSNQKNIYELLKRKEFKKDEINYTEFEEEFPSLKFEIKNVVFKNTPAGRISLEFDFYNRENTTVYIRGARQNAFQYTEVKANEGPVAISLNFSKKTYSNIILVQKENTLFEIAISDSQDNAWKGENIKDILSKLPIDVPNRLVDLIPRVARLYRKDDDVYERLTHHMLTDEDFAKTIKTASENISIIKATYENMDLQSYEDEEDEEENENYNKFLLLKEEGLYNLEKILEELKNGV